MEGGKDEGDLWFRFVLVCAEELRRGLMSLWMDGEVCRARWMLYEKWKRGWLSAAGCAKCARYPKLYMYVYVYPQRVLYIIAVIPASPRPDFLNERQTWTDFPTAILSFHIPYGRDLLCAPLRPPFTAPMPVLHPLNHSSLSTAQSPPNAH